MLRRSQQYDILSSIYHPPPQQVTGQAVCNDVEALVNNIIDHLWFVDKLRSLKLSQRQLAKMMGVDPASVSYMLRGKRNMSMGEAKEIAGYLNVNVTEVMRRAGINVTDDMGQIPIAGYITKGSLVSLLPPGTHDMVHAPADTPRGSYALQMRNVNSSRDGWLYFVSGVNVTPEDALDKACVVAMSDGSMIVAVVHKGYKKDLYNCLDFSNQDQVFENKEIKWASRILWIQPS